MQIKTNNVHTVTVPRLLGNVSIIMVMAEVSEAPPPIAEVVLIRKQKTMNVFRSVSIPQNLKVKMYMEIDK